MLDLPSRESLAALTRAANALVPAVALGFARGLDAAGVAVSYSSSYGIAEYVLSEQDIPDVLRPSTAGPRYADAGTIGANPDRAIEWQLLAGGVQQVFSVRLPDLDPAARFWIGVSQGEALTGDQRRGLEALGATTARLLKPAASRDQTAEQLRRLELAAGLLPALLRVLDVREVFDRLSISSQAALPHDMLTLGLFNDDLTALTIYARTGGGADEDRVFPQPYPAAVIKARHFDIIDDRTTYPWEGDRPAPDPGMRSSLRLPFKFDDRVIGGLAFHAWEAARYSHADVVVGRRLADYVAVALSHHHLAGQLAEQARRNEELRARTTNLELLDELLAEVTDSGDLRDVFGRISAIARKVLPHDGLGLPVILADGRHARRYASNGLEVVEAPEILEIPQAFLHPDWEYDLIDDVRLHSEPHNRSVAGLSFRSALRVPIRLDGRLAALLAFVSFAPAAFKQADVLVARRTADRLAVALARDRLFEASKRADAASARAVELEGRVRALTEELDSRTGHRKVVGESPQWRQVLTQATQVASTATTVLLLGESGTGKEVIARFVHRASPRNGGPFVALNCAALPEQLLEAELFGYERGAYTGATQSKPGQLEQAAGGTLFLDEVAELSPSAQAKCLRVLQEREFQRLGGTRVLRTDARVIAATNRDLQRAIANGQFREDLYYRLNVFAIRLPALRDRRDDVLPLSVAFLAEISRGLGRPPSGISRDARQMLGDYHWPGNVRELRNILERAAILCDGGLLTAEHLALKVSPAPMASLPSAIAPPAATGPVAAAAESAPPSSAGELQTMERAMIEQALQSARFNKSKAARALGLTRHQLYIRMRRYGFEP